MATRAGSSAPPAPRNERLLVGSMAVYGLVLAGLALYRGVELTPSVVAIAAALVGVLALRRHLPLREWIPFVAIALAYELIRGFEAAITAMVHVVGIIDVERWLLGGTIATAILQAAFPPTHPPGIVATLATVIYVLHVPLPIVVAAYLWFRHRPVFGDYVAALLLLSMAAFITYVLLPVAPPWWAAAHGFIPGPGGHPLITYLQPPAFTAIVNSAGLDGHALFALAFGDISPDRLASFPSIHAAYPFLAYLFARRVLGRSRWLVLAYTLAAWFSIMYLGDHYLVDVLGGIAYAAAAYWLVACCPVGGRSLCSADGRPALSRWLPLGGRDGGASGRGRQPAQ